MIQKFPLSAKMLERIRYQIQQHAEAFATDIVPIKKIGASSPGGRILVEAASWPIEKAIEYFEKEGVGRKDVNLFKILNKEYFGIKIESLEVPVSFSIDKRIEADLTIMMNFYAQLYDIENRLRYFFSEALKAIVGNDFIKELSRKTRDNIENEKRRMRLFVTDLRIGDLQYAQFNDLMRILENFPAILPDAEERQLVLEKLKILTETRNVIAHNNLLLPPEGKRINDASDIIRKIVDRQLAAM